MHFNAAPILLNDHNASELPARFSNEVYLSEISSNSGVQSKYTSAFSIKYVLAGSERYLINKRHYCLRKGEALFVNAGSETEFIIDGSPGGIHSGISFFLDEELVSEVVSSLNSSELETRASGNISSAFFQDINYLSHYPALKDFIEFECTHITKLRDHYMLDNHFYFRLAEQLLQAHGIVGKQVDSIDKVKLSTRLEIFRRIAIVTEEINNGMEEFDLEKLAKKVWMTKYNLIRYFKMVTGMTPLQFYIDQRIITAKSYLRKNSVTDTAFFCGYKDVCTFSRQFKAKTGLSPATFQASLQ